jgi:hypothetical protein
VDRLLRRHLFNSPVDWCLGYPFLRIYLFCLSAGAGRAKHYYLLFFTTPLIITLSIYFPFHYLIHFVFSLPYSVGVLGVVMLTAGGAGRKVWTTGSVGNPKTIEVPGPCRVCRASNLKERFCYVERELRWRD